jgi:transcriptional regulator with XRE-family HTH domain
MGRPIKAINEELFFDMAERGFTQQQMAADLGVTIPTLERRIADIQAKQGILLKYRELQSLQLTSIQCRILENITEDKIAQASLGELVCAFKILKDKEQVIEGKPSEIKGLVGYLIQLEKQNTMSDIACTYTDTDEEELEDAVYGLQTLDRMPAL